MNDIKDKIEALRSKLHYYNFEYYVNDKSLISDFDFDHLMKDYSKFEAVNVEEYANTIGFNGVDHHINKP